MVAVEKKPVSIIVCSNERLETNFPAAVKLFYTGPFVNAELLVLMLEKHGLAATQNFVDVTAPDDGDLNRPTQVFVPATDYDRAYQLFYAERADEL